MIELLFVFLIISFLIVYKIHKDDIMSPSVVLLLVYCLCVGFAFINFDLWELGEYSNKAFFIIVFSVISFVAVGIVFERVLYYKRKILIKPDVQTKEAIADELYIPNWFLYLNLFVCLISILWSYSVAGGISKNAEYVNIQIPQILSLLTRYVYIQGYFCSCLFVRNLVKRKFNSCDLIILFCIIASCVCSILLGTRITMLKIIACMTMAGYISWRKKHGWNKSIKFKTLLYCLVGFVLFLLLFYYLKKYKIGDSSSFDILSYLSMYISAPIKLLDLFVQKPVNNEAIFGKETFVLINYNLAELGFGQIYDRHLEFRALNNAVHLGNVYGAVRRFYSDFGMAGCIILSGVFSCVFHKWYRKIKYSKSRSFDFRCLIYSYLFPCVVLFPIDDIFFSQLSIGMLLDIVVLYILYLIIIKKKIIIKFM